MAQAAIAPLPTLRRFTSGPGPCRRRLDLHQLRHSDLTHEAEDDASTPMLLARSRHASVRSLERYVRPSVDAVGAYVAGRDPGTLSDMVNGRRRSTFGSVQAVCAVLGLGLRNVIVFADGLTDRWAA